MSEDNKDVDAAEAAADEPIVEETPPEEPANVEAPATGEKKEKSTSSISWLALFLSLVTLAAVGYMVMEDRRTRSAAESSSDTIEQLAGRVDASRESLSDLNQELADLASSDEVTRAQIESLQRRIEERLELLDSLPRRMSSLESSMSALQGLSLIHI